MEEIEQLAAKMDRNTVLFIGSGASSPAGLPSWWELINWLKDYTSSLGGDIDAANLYLKKSQLIYATSALTSELNKIEKSLADFFNEEPKCEIFTSATPKEIHQLIAQLPTSSIITPNYDLLLEKIFIEIGKPMEVVYKGDNDRINSILRDAFKDYIYKYHGCITKPADIIFDFKQYNRYVSSKEFWEKVNGENVLFFEVDSCLCDNSDMKIDDFTKYDYVGAPWSFNNKVGNSGFSLRKKSKMLEIINKCKYTNQNTDDYFSSGCKNVKINKPNFEEAKKFCVETIYYDNPIGVHKPWNKEVFLKNKNLYSKLKKSCPCLNNIEIYETCRKEKNGKIRCNTGNTLEWSII